MLVRSEYVLREVRTRNTLRAVFVVISWFSIGSDIRRRVFFLDFFSIYSHRTRISNIVPAPVRRVKNVQNCISSCAHELLYAVLFLHGLHWPAPLIYRLVRRGDRAFSPHRPSQVFRQRCERARTTTQQ